MTPRLRYPDLAPEGTAAMRALEHYLNTGTCLDPVLLELVRLRASLLNGCEYCISLHRHELARHHEPQSRIDAVTSWTTSGAFTERERAALRWTEVITNIQQSHAADDEYNAILQHFTPADTVNLTMAIVSINAFNRMAIAFRAEHVTPPPAQSPIADDGGKVEVEN
jgi:AhpD family alkylhydroperoxidase